MHDVVARHPIQWLQGVSAWLRDERDRTRDLLQLAGDVEQEHPQLARELRGIAMHQASAAAAAAPVAPPSWLARTWQTLEAMGRARAQRDLLALAQRWESTQPELAKELRAACMRE
jgi:hypothetical protein